MFWLPAARLFFSRSWLVLRLIGQLSRPVRRLCQLTKILHLDCVRLLGVLYYPHGQLTRQLGVTPRT
jgi:hypothetical protein